MTLLFHVLIAAAVAGLLVVTVPPLGHWWHHHQHHHPTTRTRFRPPSQGQAAQPALIGAMLSLMMAAWLLLMMR